MVHTRFLKDTSNHLVQRWILDAHVDHRVAVKNHPEDFRDPRSVDLEIDDRTGATADLAEDAQVFRRRTAVEMELHQLGAAELFRDLGQRAVIDHFTMTDYQYPGAESLDIAHVMAGQEHGDAVANVVIAQAFLDGGLSDDIEPDRRFV